MGFCPERKGSSRRPMEVILEAIQQKGQNALLSLTTGTYNTAVGFVSLLSDTTGAFNTAIGAGSLLLSTADENTATGALALLNNTTGNFNTANGAFALISNTTGFYNTAVGDNALGPNTTGNHNAAMGDHALEANTTGSFNTATGHQAIGNITTGNNNTATGTYALFNDVTGNGNTADGIFALGNATGSRNIGIGVDAGCHLTSGDNNIFIGSFGVDTESNTIRIGHVVPEMNCNNFVQDANTATYIAGISGTAVVGDMVVVDANGQLGTMSSSRRFKKEIKPMDKTSEAILALKPVSFQYKSDTKGTPRFGLIAEEVAKVNPDLVVRDRKGEIYSVRYEAVNAMLLNEFLKSTEGRGTKKGFRRAEIGNDRPRGNGQRAGGANPKVSAQLEATKPAPQVVNNP